MYIRSEFYKKSSLKNVFDLPKWGKNIQTVVYNDACMVSKLEGILVALMIAQGLNIV